MSDCPSCQDMSKRGSVPPVCPRHLDEGLVELFETIRTRNTMPQPSAKPHRLGTARTVGELRRLLESYTDECAIAPIDVAYHLDLDHGSRLEFTHPENARKTDD